MEINFISIYDNTAEARCLFVSESVTDILGYLPEELIGLGGYCLTHPDERQALKIIHRGNVRNELMSSAITYRNRHKDDHYVTVDVVLHYCYNVLICTNFAVTNSDCGKRRVRANSADQAFIVQQKNGSIRLTGSSWNDSQERIKTLLTEGCPWNNHSNVIAKPEPRFCLFINRYTSLSIIVFATQMCEELVGLNQIDLIGESLYRYVDAKDRANVEKVLNLSKSSDLINRIRFKWKSQDGDELVPIEAVISCTFDGLVFVGRKSACRIE